MDAAHAVKASVKQHLHTSHEPKDDPPKETPAPVDGTSKPHRLVVAAGPSYATHSHIPVPVNARTPILLNTPSLLVLLHVRIRTFHGLPTSTSRPSSPYFSASPRPRDLYSISFAFIPKRPLRARDLVWGNDFDYPVRRYLPPGFNYAFRLVKQFVDPGLKCDAYADRPWVLGPALSCWFVWRIGEMTEGVAPCAADGQDVRDVPAWAGREEHEAMKRTRVDLLARTGETYAGPPADAALVRRWLDLFPASFHDGDTPLTEGDASSLRADRAIPPEPEARRKHFLADENRDFELEAGRLYAADFCNPYIDFDAARLQLPGFGINALRWAGDKTHVLRYVFKDQSNGELLFCVTLAMLLGEDVRRGEEAEGRAPGGEGTAEGQAAGGQQVGGQQAEGQQNEGQQAGEQQTGGQQAVAQATETCR